jgi:abequosyltransferase
LRKKEPRSHLQNERQPETTKPLLTIAIPTYNRAWCLRELLPLLFDQAKDEPRLELIISDNASTDDTPLVVHQFVARGLRVRYLRNTQNIGPDANFLQCFEQARGKYVWLFSDDDLIVPGALKKVLNYCGSAEYDLLWVSNYSFGGLHRPHAAGPNNDALEISDPRAYAKRVHIFFTFISGNIINRDRVLEGHTPSDFSSLVGTNFIQLGWAYTALNGFTRGLYIREKLVAVRANNTGGYKLLQVFGPGLATITEEWLKSASVRRIIINGTVQRFWPLMLLRYKNSCDDFVEEADPEAVLTPVFKDNLRYWVFVFPIIVLPYPLAAIWGVAVRILNRLDKAAGYPMLSSRYGTTRS